MKVMIVDDEVMARDFFKVLVESYGHEVETAPNALEGLKTLQNYPADMIISDIMMPGMSGLDFLKEVRKNSKEVIMVLMTGFGSEDSAIEALRHGADNYLKKPVRRDELGSLLVKYAEITRERSARKRMTGLVLHRKLTLQLENNVKLIPEVVDTLAQETEGLLDPQKQRAVRLGLFELIINAIEHGNLGIGSELKAQALQEGNLEDIYLERLADPDIAQRRVTIECDLNNQFCQWTIADEGEGFEPAKIPNPLQNYSESRHLSGRGIFVSRYQFDSIEYVEPCNKVIARKNV